MGLLFIVTMCTVGGVYYMSKVAPRVASRMAAGAASSAGGAQAASAAWESASRAASGMGMGGGPSYRLPYHEFEHGFLPSMTKDEALLILGLESRVGSLREVPVADIKTQHRAMMKGHHSDVNGSPYLASKINEARTVLLDGRKA